MEGPANWSTVSGHRARRHRCIQIVNCDPDFLYMARSMAAYAAFIKKSRMRFAKRHKLHRKSG